MGEGDRARPERLSLRSWESKQMVRTTRGSQGRIQGFAPRLEAWQETLHGGVLASKRWPLIPLESTRMSSAHIKGYDRGPAG